MGQSASHRRGPTKLPTSDPHESERLTVSELTRDGQVDMRLVTIAFWKNHQDGEFIGKLCEALSKLIDAKPVLDQVEFYLPQLAHLVLYLEADLDITAIEQFVMLVSQCSVHFALQFFWIVYAALDENRPKRAQAKAKIFMRCTQLLLTLEQCLVYGSPVACKAQELFENQFISKLEMEEILMADRRFFAAQNVSLNEPLPLTHPDSNTSGVIVEGWLQKKGGGTSRLGRRSWNQRWCRMERRIMFIYTRPSDIRARSVVPLDRAEVGEVIRAHDEVEMNFTR